MRGSRSSHQLDAATVPERMQPVVSLLTAGLHAHGLRIERLEREVDRHEGALATMRLSEERVSGRAPEANAAAVMAERMAKLEEKCAGLERRCKHAEVRAEERAHQTSNATSEAAAARSAVSSLREQLGAAGSSSVREADVRAAQLGVERLEGELRSMRERCEAQAQLSSELPALRRDVEEVRLVGAAASSALSQLKAEVREAAPRLAELASRGELERLAAEGRASAESTRRSLEEQSRQLSQLAAEHRRAEPARSAAQPDGASSAVIELVDSHTALHVKALSAELLRSLDSKAAASEVAASLDALRRELGALAQAQRALVTEQQAGADASASAASVARKLAAEAAAQLAQHELSVRGSERRGREAAERLGELEARLQAGLAERPSVKEVEELVARARPPRAQGESQQSATPSARPAHSPPLTWRGEAAWSRGDAPSRGGDTSRADEGERLAAAAREKLAERLEAVDDASRAALSKVERRLARMAVQVDDAVRAAQGAVAQAVASAPALAAGSSAREAALSELGALQSDVGSLAEALRQHLLAQPALLQPLWAENQLGRWIWTSGRLNRAKSASTGSAGVVPWEHERANTAPDNYLFSAGRAQVRVVAPGLYSVACAFFAHAGPTIAICVNGAEVVRRAGHARRPAAQQHEVGHEIGGVSMREFLSLPPDASVTVCFDANGAPMGDAQGFLELRKL